MDGALYILLEILQTRFSSKNEAQISLMGFDPGSLGNCQEVLKAVCKSIDVNLVGMFMDNLSHSLFPICFSLVVFVTALRLLSSSTDHDLC